MQKDKKTKCQNEVDVIATWGKTGWVTEGTHFEVWVGRGSLQDSHLSYEIMKKTKSICSSSWHLLSQRWVMLVCFGTIQNSAPTTHSMLPHLCYTLTVCGWIRGCVKARMYYQGAGQEARIIIQTPFEQLEVEKRALPSCLPTVSPVSWAVRVWLPQHGVTTRTNDGNQGDSTSCLFLSLTELSTRATDEYQGARRLSSLVSNHSGLVVSLLIGKENNMELRGWIFLCFGLIG